MSYQRNDPDCPLMSHSNTAINPTTAANPIADFRNVSAPEDRVALGAAVVCAVTVCAGAVTVNIGSTKLDVDVGKTLEVELGSMVEEDGVAEVMLAVAVATKAADSEAMMAFCW